MSFAATSVALERVKGLRIRLSAMDPHDGPVSAYKSAQQELHDAEVDYNYCLYFPVDEAFQPPPLSTARKFTPKRKGSRERRLRMWSMVEQCTREGTLQDLKEGKIRVSSAERLGQPSPAQRSASESSGGLEQTNGQRDLQRSTITDSSQIQILGQFALIGILPQRICISTNGIKLQKLKKRLGNSMVTSKHSPT